MAIKASEISELIKERIKNFESAAEARDIGTVIAVTDGITRIHGLGAAQYGEMLEFPGETFGLALNLEQDSTRSRRRGASSRCRSVSHCSGASSIRSASRSTAVARSRPSRVRRSRKLRPASSRASRCRNPCRPV